MKMLLHKKVSKAAHYNALQGGYMIRVLFLCTVLILLQAAAIHAGDKGEKAKELSGMSIVGNDEAPKSLYIVPWKSSEIGVESSLDMLLDEGDVPVDREVFKRQLEFYEVSRSE